MDRFQFVVIGAGPAGEAAAFKARELDATVAVVDRLWPHKARVVELAQQKEAEEDEVEPVMKAEAEPHHEHTLTPLESERPEVEAARKVEGLAARPPKSAPAPERSGKPASEKPGEPASEKPAAQAPAPQKTAPEKTAPEKPVSEEPAAEAVRKPASVGKSGAQGDTDDLV